MRALQDHIDDVSIFFLLLPPPCPRAEESFQYCDIVTIEIPIFIFELEIIKIDPVNIRLIGLNSRSDHVWLILLERSISTLIALGNSW